MKPDTVSLPRLVRRAALPARPLPKVLDLDALLDWLLTPLRQFPLVGLLLVAALCGALARRLFLSLLGMISTRTQLPWRECCEQQRVPRWLAILVAGTMLHLTVASWADWPAQEAIRVRHGADLIIVFAATMCVVRLLSALQALHANKAGGERRSFKGVVQVLQLLTICVAVLLVLARLTNQPPALVLSSLGAAAALGAFIFRDVLLSFLAGMRIMSDDIVRVGDWIQTADGGINGKVVEIDLHDVSVANFDGSLARVGTRRLLAETFRNWRGVRETRSRRITFKLLIDPRSIRFCDEAPGGGGERTSDQTRLGEFRRYATQYLGTAIGIDASLPLMVRTLDATPEGVPVECAAYSQELESQQADALRSSLIEHLLAMLPRFELTAYRKGGG